jgi:uncharacterized protein (DUF58 family)
VGRLLSWFRPSQRSRWTRSGLGYLLVWVGLLFTGLYQQVNLLLLTAGLAAGPIVASFFLSAAMLRRLTLTRRAPEYVFAGEPLVLDYMLQNRRGATAALAIDVIDEITPADRGIPGAVKIRPRVMFERVPAGQVARLRWKGPSPVRGRYTLDLLEMVTRSPFGLLERREAASRSESLIVYPAVGRLTRRWTQLYRDSIEARRGRRHDRSAQQQEYHGLREYRPGDSMRWIHWRTTARIGRPMVREFEQQSEQEVAVLLDPWLPRSKVSAEQREALEAAIRFAATVCFEICKHSGRRFLLGWTGPTPGLRHGPSSVKLLHEMLEPLAVMRGTSEGQLSALIDAMPVAMLRDALIVIVSTRPVNLAEEAERSARLAEASIRGLAGRSLVLDASRRDLDPFVQFPERPEPPPGLLSEDRPDLDSDGDPSGDGLRPDALAETPA